MLDLPQGDLPIIALIAVLGRPHWRLSGSGPGARARASWSRVADQALVLGPVNR